MTRRLSVGIPVFNYPIVANLHPRRLPSRFHERLYKPDWEQHQWIRVAKEQNQIWGRPSWGTEARRILLHMAQVWFRLADRSAHARNPADHECAADPERAWNCDQEMSVLSRIWRCL
jgi:hypothetical protein